MCCGSGDEGLLGARQCTCMHQVAASLPCAPCSPCSGAAQAGIICWFLFQASRGVDAFFDRQSLPDPVTQYTAHNIAVLVQTVSRGLVYLITFIFGANTLGLAGEGRSSARMWRLSGCASCSGGHAFGGCLSFSRPASIWGRATRSAQ